MKIKALLVISNQEPQLVKIPATLKFIKAFIGGTLHKIKLNKNTMLIINSTASIEDFNKIYKGQIILGTFFIVSTKKNHLTSMKNRDIQKYTNMFKLRKHQKKIDIYKNEYLEEYYSNQQKLKQKNAEKNKNQIFNIAA